MDQDFFYEIRICALNDGKYFLLGNHALQGDSISSVLFILALKILFHLIKSNLDRSNQIKDWQFLTIATFTQHKLIIQPFLQDTISTKHLVDTLFFPYFLD